MFSILLKDNFEIADYIEKSSINYVDKELIEDYFYGCYAVLKECNIVDLKIEDQNNHIPDSQVEELYMSLPIKTMPPMVVENMTIVDGHHRFRVLKSLKIKKAKIYEVKEL